MVRRVQWLFILPYVLVTVVWSGQGVHAQTRSPGSSTAFDPAAAVGMLTDATKNESSAAPPFLGLASRVEVDRLFGTATATIPIELPPGRKGMTPDLALRYSSNSGNGPFGVGWDLPLGSIKRNTARGVPVDILSGQYIDSKGFVLVFRGGAIVLDTCKDPGTCNSWGAIGEEAWLDVQFNRSANQFVVTDKDGTSYTYGATATARTGKNTSASTGTFSWNLTDVTDTNGNAIQVVYTVYDGASYPTQVNYGANASAPFSHIFHAALGYDVRPDVTSSYRGGFEQKSTRRLVSITVTVDVPSVTQIRQYQFGYSPQDPDTGLSLLRSVSETVTGTTPPPPTTFTYSTSARSLAASADLTFVPPVPTEHVVSRNFAYAGPNNQTMGFLDVDGDGLPEFLDGYSAVAPSGQGPNGGLAIYRNRGGGRFEKDAAFWTTNAKVTGPAWPWTLMLDLSYISGPIIRLVDMDGDGLPDLLRSDSSSCFNAGASPTCSWNWWKNRQGVLDTTAGQWTGAPNDLGGPTFPNLPNPGGNWASLIDLNGDGLPDVLDCTGVNINSGPYSCRFYQNNGSGFATSVTWLVPIANDAGGFRQPLYSEAGVTLKVLTDINGDGLPDLVCSRPTSGTGHWDVWLNTGSGFLTSPIPWAAPPFSGNAYHIDEGPYVSRGLRDMNGDGLPDYVASTTTPWTVYLNTGAGFNAGVPWAGTTGIPYLSKNYVYNTNPPSDDVARTITQVFDINGDGLADYVDTSGELGATYHARYGVAPRNTLLVHQDNGMGGTADLAYVASTDPSTAGAGCVGGTNPGAPCMTSAECTGGGTCTTPSPDASQLPFATWVVQTQTLHSGMSGTGNDLTTSFAYAGGFFDPVQHQFRGFMQSVETRAADSRKIRRQFRPPPYTLGSSPPWYSIVTYFPFKEIAEEVWAGTQRLTSTTTDWDALYIGGGRSQLHPTKRIDTAYSTASGVTTTKVRTETFGAFDAYNNVTQDTVTPDPADGLTAIVTNTTYGAAGPCHAQPTEIKVTSGLVLSDKLFGYSADAKCNLTTVQPKLAASGQSAATGTPITTLTVAYDTTPAGKAGQPTTITDALSHATTLDYTTSCAAQGLFPCKITNALSQATQKTYDLKWGRPTQINEPSGAITSMAYDGLGRLTSIVRPLDTTAWRQFVYAFGTGGSSPTPSRIDTLVREPNAINATPPGTRTISTFYDSFGRPLETKQQQYIALNVATVVKDAVAFDSAGRVAKRYIPFTTASAITTYTVPTSSSSTNLAYDTLDRITQTTNPDGGTYRTADYGTAGQVASFDENYNECAVPTGRTASCPGAKTIEYRDSLGRVAKSELFAGTTLKTRTTNVYDGLNRVTNTTVTDPGTGKTSPTDFQFDSFSRRTAMIDADSGPSGVRGTWAYAYDNAGNLVYQDDPKTPQHIEFCYDTLNRISRKLYPTGDAQQSPTNYATACSSASPGMPYLKYLYDVQSSYSCDVNGTGRLCAVEENLTNPADNAFVRTVFIYDLRGRVIKEYNERGALGKSVNYTRLNTYDFADRLVGVTYPTNFTTTNEAVAYTYDDLGQLNMVASGQQTYASSLSYDIFGRTTQWIDGSGLRNTASFSSSSFDFRLSQVKVADAGGTIYEQLDYGTNYDVAGNLRTLTDNTPTTRYASTSVLRDSWTYVYDGLGRLTSAQPVAPAPRHSPTTAWATCSPATS